MLVFWGAPLKDVSSYIGRFSRMLELFGAPLKDVRIFLGLL